MNETSLKQAVIEEIRACGVNSGKKGELLENMAYADLLRLAATSHYRKGL